MGNAFHSFAEPGGNKNLGESTQRGGGGGVG